MARRTRRFQSEPHVTISFGRTQGKDQEGLEERFINDFIGRGVFTTKKFFKDDFLLVYRGELISADEGYQREESYHADLGNFLFFFKDGAKIFCVDATFSNGLGRLVNDAPLNQSDCNSVIRKVKEGTATYLTLYALRDIEIGEELRYDYGIKDLPWRKLKVNKKEVSVNSDEASIACAVDEASSKGALHNSGTYTGNYKGSQKEDENMESCTRVHAHTKGNCKGSLKEDENMESCNAHTRGSCKGSQKEDENMESCTRVHAHTRALNETMVSLYGNLAEHSGNQEELVGLSSGTECVPDSSEENDKEPHLPGSAQKRRHASSSVEGLEKLHPTKKKQVSYKAIVSEPESDSDHEGGDADESSDSSMGGKVLKKPNDKGNCKGSQKEDENMENSTRGHAHTREREFEMPLVCEAATCSVEEGSSKSTVADEGSESEESSANDSGNELPNAELQNPSGHARNEQQSRIERTSNPSKASSSAFSDTTKKTKRVTQVAAKENSGLTAETRKKKAHNVWTKEEKDAVVQTPWRVHKK